MSQNEVLRIVAKEIYEEDSKRISNCFTLEGLKNISVIYIPKDAPVWVIETATHLQEQIEKKYPETSVALIKIQPLFYEYSFSDDYMEGVYHEISGLTGQADGKEKLLLCRAKEAAALLRMHDNAVQKYGKTHLPTLFLDVDAFRYCKPYVLIDVAACLNLSVQVLSSFAPYDRKIYSKADYCVVYASGYESWQDLIHAWHFIKQEHEQTPQIIYVDDLRRWTSLEYAENIFKKFTTLLRRMSVKNVEIEVIPSVEHQLVLNIIGEKPTIVFIPQLKTYLCKALVAPELTFDIYALTFEEYWNFLGPIGRQYFCQEVKEFMTWRPESTRLKFNKLFEPRSFKDWNLKFYWWNYKIRLNSFCRQIFLSEFMLYR